MRTCVHAILYIHMYMCSMALCKYTCVCMCTSIPSHPHTERLLLPLLKAEKIVSFIPPDGSFTLLNYHLGSSRYSQPTPPMPLPISADHLFIVNHPLPYSMVPQPISVTPQFHFSSVSEDAPTVQYGVRTCTM